MSPHTSFQQNQKPLKKWRFNTWQDRTKVIAGSVIGFGLTALSLSYFLPIAVTATFLGIGAALYISATAPKPKEKKAKTTTIKDIFNRVTATRAEDSHILVKLAQKYNKTLNNKEEVSVFISNKPRKNSASIAPDTNEMTMTETTFNQYKAKPENLAFIVAHELSHTKNDSRSIQTILRGASSIANGMAILALGGSMVTTLFGLTASVIAVPILPVVGTYYLAKMAFGFASRTMEKRADRNALWLTQNYDAAMDCMETLYPTKKEKKIVPIISLLRTHPSYHFRVANLKRAWKKAQKSTPPAHFQNTPKATPSVTVSV